MLLIVEAASEGEINRRLADDPWVIAGRLVTASVESWTIVIGGERLMTARLAGS